MLTVARNHVSQELPFQIQPNLLIYCLFTTIIYCRFITNIIYCLFTTNIIYCPFVTTIVY